MSIAQQVSMPSGWSYAYAFTVGGGYLYGTPSTDYNDICRLNKSTGAVLETYDEVGFFYYYYNHLCYGDNGLWCGSYYSPMNEIEKYDPALGRIRRVIEMPDWSTTGRIHDQSFTENGDRMWALTYGHEYHITGTYTYTIHLLDVSPVLRMSESLGDGTIAAESSQDVNVVFDGQGAASGIHRATLKIESDGGMREKPYVFVVHAPGANTAPTADAGADQVLDATAPTMSVTLDGTGSSDPNGDELVYSWTGDGLPAEALSEGGLMGESVTVDLAPGVHDITLRVDDMRGGFDTDTVRITLRAPDIEVDDCYVAYPEGGGTVSGAITVRNNGDKTLNWSVSDTLQLDSSSIIREFEVTWKSSYSAYAYPYTMTYDASRDCLWVAYYYDDEVGKINASNGSTITTKSVGSGRRVYALDMEGPDLWAADYYEKKFRKYNPDTMANTQTINNPWGTGYGPCSMARDSGQFYASQYYSYDICKLNAGSGAVEKTHPVGERQYYYNHHDAIGGKVWYTRCNAPRNRIHCMDGTSGNMLRSLEMDDWDTDAYMYDLSFVNSAQCWMLTYNVKGDGKRWAHLVDLSVADKFSKAATSGSTAAGGTTTFTVSLDTDGLAIGWYPVVLTFASNDPDEPVYEKEIIFIIHEDSPNNPPTANAGPGVVRNINGVTAPFILDLDASGSTDPDGDTLFSTWTMDPSAGSGQAAQPVEMTDKGLIELGGGVYTFELTVEDLRGGVDMDSFTMTVNAKTPREGWRAWHGTLGDGHSAETNVNWLQNWPPIVEWNRMDIKDGGYSGNSSPVVSDGYVYHCGKGGIRCVYAKTGKSRWSRGFAGGNPVPAIDDDYIFVGTKSGTGGSQLACYDKLSGARKWITGNIGSTQDADGSGVWISPMVFGDLVVWYRYGMNRHTGEVLWNGRYDTYHKPFDWEGRTVILSDKYLCDPLTGAQLIYAGPDVSAREGWYVPTVTHGTNKVWSISGIYAIGGTLEQSFGNLGATTYTQPFTIGDRGFFIDGGHCAGGPVYSVDLNSGQKWNAGGVGTAIAVGNQAVGHGYGTVRVMTPTASGVTGKSWRYDVGSGGLTELAYADQRVYIMSSQGLTCLYFGLAPPVLAGNGATWDPKTATAEIKADLINTGGSTPEIYLCLGSSNGGSDPAQWEHCVPLGARTAGDISATVTGLSNNALYYYRFWGTNDTGMAWARQAVECFSTYPESCVEGQDGSLVLHWPLDETCGITATDLSLYGHNGTLSGGWGYSENGGEWVTGVMGNAARFDGAEALHTANRMSVQLQDQWTLSFWFRTWNNEAGHLASLGRQGAGSNYSGGVPGFNVKVDKGSRTVTGCPSTVVTDGKWRHMTYVRSGKTVTAYMNGVFQSQWSPILEPYAYLELGGSRADWKKIDLDDVRVYRRCLTLTEIQALHDMAAGNETEPGAATEAQADDAAEASDGTVCLDGPELALGQDLVGVRFPNIAIPRGATILSAVIEFGAGGETNLVPLTMTQSGLVNCSDGQPFTGSDPSVSGDGRFITWVDAGWARVAYPLTYQLTSSSVLEFEFESTVSPTAGGNGYAIGMDNRIPTTASDRAFQVFGDDRVGITSYKGYFGGVRRYSIPIGQHYTGSMEHLVFYVYEKWSLGGQNRFGNVRVWTPGVVQNEPTLIAIHCESADDATAFSATARNLSTRPRTRTAVAWKVPSWSGGTVHSAPDVAAVLQEVVDRNGWSSGNAAVFLLTGSGRRLVDARDKAGGTPPRLRVMWTDAEDSDGDGLPDSWERAILDGKPSTVDPGDDGDGDGIINVQEFVMGTDGGDATSVLKVGIRIAPDGRPVICFDGQGTDRAGTEGILRFYYLDMMTNLLNDSWHCIGTITNTVDRFIEHTNDVPDLASAFYRLRVALDLPMPPVANAGPDQATTNTTVMLDGSGSSDANGDPLTYEWLMVDGSMVYGVRPTVTLPVGTHTITLTVYDGRGGTDSDTVVIDVVEAIVSVGVDGVTNQYLVLSYIPGTQDGQDGLPTSAEVLDGGTTLRVSGNAWKKIDLGSYTVTASTVLEFDFSSSSQGDIQGIGFDVDDAVSPTNSFQLYGTQVWGLQDHNDYSGSAPGVKHYTIPVGTHFTGTFKYLTFINDHDVDPATAVGTFSNVRIYTP